VSYQVHSQESAENRIKCQTETRPPVGYTGIVDEAAMDKIKNTVPNKGCDYEPEISFEAEHGNQQKAACNRAFNDQSATRSSHRSEQYIVESDHDQHGR
jgi:hypothetical protein